MGINRWQQGVAGRGGDRGRRWTGRVAAEVATGIRDGAAGIRETWAKESELEVDSPRRSVADKMWTGERGRRRGRAAPQRAAGGRLATAGYRRGTPCRTPSTYCWRSTKRGGRGPKSGGCGGATLSRLCAKFQPRSRASHTLRHVPIATMLSSNRRGCGGWPACVRAHANANARARARVLACLRACMRTYAHMCARVRVCLQQGSARRRMPWPLYWHPPWTTKKYWPRGLALTE